MFSLFLKGGPIMWPLLVTSVVSLSVVIERVIYHWRKKRTRHPEIVQTIVQEVERGNIKGALVTGQESADFIAKILVYALEQPTAFSNAVIRASGIELKRFGRGLSTLDTIITLAPLLGLLGTVTGMIHAFGLLGANELEAPNAITGGIAEALIATAFGLAIAIGTLIPFNFLNSTLEEVRHEIEEVASQVELFLQKPKNEPLSDECIHYGSKQVMFKMLDGN